MKLILPYKNLKLWLKTWLLKNFKLILFFAPALLSIFLIIILLLYANYIQLKNNVASLTSKESILKNKTLKAEKELKDLKNENQYIINKKLQEEISNIQTTYKKSVSVYESLTDLKQNVKNTQNLDNLYSQTISYLSQKNYSSAQASLNNLADKIKTEQDKITASFSISASVPIQNTPPSAGFARQSVQTDNGVFMIDIVSADLSSTRVVVDTASESDCRDNCPTLALSDYVSRSGAYAGINGSYFCPASYPSCAGKTNSFDLLVMNKNKHYFNSDNNVYSTNPAVIFGSGWIRFVTKTLEWGRDTGVDGVLSNFPLLVLGNQVVYAGSGDPKFNSKGPRNFVANRGNTAYIGIVYNADMSDSAKVLKTLGMDNAMNLDEGGSTALWYQGYKAGPGRNIPNAILFVKK